MKRLILNIALAASLSSICVTAGSAFAADSARVHCHRDLEAKCGADTAACVFDRDMHFSIEACRNLGVYDGQYASIPDLRRPRNGEMVGNRCTFEHEMVHVRDADDRLQEGAQTEVSAYSVGRSCLMRYYRQNCSPARNGFAQRDCDLISYKAWAQRAMKYIVTCAAAGRSSRECIKSCTRETRNAEECKGTYEMYKHHFDAHSR